MRACRPDTRCPPLGRERAQGIGGKPTAQRGRRIIGCTPLARKSPAEAGLKFVLRIMLRFGQSRTNPPAQRCPARQVPAPSLKPQLHQEPQPGRTWLEVKARNQLPPDDARKDAKREEETAASTGSARRASTTGRPSTAGSEAKRLLVPHRATMATATAACPPAQARTVRE